MTGVQHESVSPALDRTDFAKQPSGKMSDAELYIRFIPRRIEVAKEHARNGRQEKCIGDPGRTSSRRTFPS